MTPLTREAKSSKNSYRDECLTRTVAVVFIGRCRLHTYWYPVLNNIFRTRCKKRGEKPNKSKNIMHVPISTNNNYVIYSNSGNPSNQTVRSSCHAYSCLQDLRAFLELIQRVKAILIAMARIWAVAKEDLLGESLNDPEPSYFIPSNTLMVERDWGLQLCPRSQPKNVCSNARATGLSMLEPESFDTCLLLL